MCLFGQNGDTVVNATVTQNYLAGAGYPIYGGLDSTTPTPPSNVSVTDNVFGRDFFATGGYYGPLAHWYQPGNTWSGNVWAGTGQPVSAS